MLGFDYEPIQGQRLEKVQGIGPLTYEDGRIGFDSVRIFLDKDSLIISVDEDTDELIISLEKLPNDKETEAWVDIDLLKDYVGSEIGWLWCAKNWMGYADMVAFSFSGIEPRVAIVGAASKLSLYSINGI